MQAIRRMAAGAWRDPRERTIILAQGGLIFSKAISLAALIITVPWTLHYLGTERFGMWMTLSAITIVLGATDFGIGQGVLTLLARASGRNDIPEQRRIVSNSLAAMFALAIVLAGLFLLIEPLFNWVALFNVTSELAVAEARPASVLLVLMCLAAIPASLGLRIFAGLQRGIQNGLWASLGSISSLIAVLAGIEMEVSLPILLVGFIGTPIVVNAIATVYAIVSSGPALRPSFRLLSWEEVSALFRNGLRFLVIFLIFSATFVADNIVIAHVAGPEAVARYSIADRLFQLIAVVLSMINAPLWPAYAAAGARHDSGWIRRRFGQSLKLNLAFAIGASLVLVVGGHWIFGAWVGAAMVPTLALSLAVAARRSVEALYSACTALLNALDHVKFQLGWGIAMAACAVLLRFMLIDRIGAIGSALAVVVAVALFSFVPLWLNLDAILASVRKGHDDDRLEGEG